MILTNSTIYDDINKLNNIIMMTLTNSTIYDDINKLNNIR